MNKYRKIHTPNLPSKSINISVEAKNEGDTSEKLIRKFMRKFKKARLMDEIRKHDCYVKPSERKRLEEERGKRAEKKRGIKSI